MADWIDAGGRQRTELMPNSPYAARGLALSRNELLRRFETLNRDTVEMLPAEVAELHLDNSEIHISPAVTTPGTRLKNRGAPPPTTTQWPMGLRQPDVSGATVVFINHVGNAANPAIARFIESPGWKRMPWIFKISTAYGNTSGRTPPYNAEVHPAEPPCAMPKVGYGRRYEAEGVRGHIERGPPPPSHSEESGLSRIVSNCDLMAAILIAEGPAFPLEDDLSPEAGGGDVLGRWSGWRRRGMPGF